MNIDRYDLPISPWDHTATSDFGNWCRSADVARLEASHAELLEACKTMFDEWCEYEMSIDFAEYSYPSQKYRTMMDKARAAIAKAEGEQL